MILFEIHTFREGSWKIDSVFDDKDLAIYEAQRMEKGGRFSAVRVVQETYDEETQKTGTRTVYRTTKVDRMNVDVERRRAQPLTVAAPPRPPKKKKKGVSPVMMLLTLSAIVLGGIAVLYLLQNFSAKF
jgi:predicted RNA-binding Zn ribbon-like protein